MTEAEINAAIDAELRGLGSARLRQVQDELGVPADGKIGSQTRAAYRARWEKQQAAASRTRIDETNAEAALTAAATQKTIADAAARKAEEDSKTNEYERSPWRQALQIGALPAGLAAGGYAGHRMAQHVGQTHIAGQDQRNAALKQLAGDINKELSSPSPNLARMKGFQGSGRNLNLKLTQGPMALPTIALALLEAGATRGAGYLAGKGTGQDIAYGASAAGLSGAAALTTERLIRRGNEARMPDARHLASLYTLDDAIASHGQGVAPSPPRPAPASGRPSAANYDEARKAGVKAVGWHNSKEGLRNAMRKLGAVPKFALPAAVGVAGFLGAREARAEGGSPAAGAAHGASDALLLGAPSAYGEARRAGYGRPASLGLGAGAAIDSLATGGMAQTMLDPEVDPEFKRTASANMALPTGSPLNASAAMGVDADAIRKVLAYLLSGPAPR